MEEADRLAAIEAARLLAEMEEADRLAAIEAARLLAEEAARLLAVKNPVDITLPDGLTILPGMYTIAPGETEDTGVVAFTCSAEGVRCLVTVADDGTITSAGGVATAMITAEGFKRLYRAQIVDLGELADNYDTITPGTYPIEPGRNTDVDDANFTCPVGSVRCTVTVAADGTVTSVEGAATAKNSDGVMTTMTAIALYTAFSSVASSPVVDTASSDNSSVASSTTGKVTITLNHTATTTDYEGEAVDSGHGIDGWDGQTLTRDIGTTRKPKLEEATVYNEY